MNDLVENRTTGAKENVLLRIQRGNPMDVSTIDPLTDLRWREFVERQAASCIFHHPAWLAALWRTYGYRPLVLTTCKAGEPLQDGLVFCQVKSWITGKRLVSLPFSDFCNVLTESNDGRVRLLASLCNSLGSEFEYAEIRLTGEDRTPPGDAWTIGSQFLHHALPLEASQELLFHSLHKSCIQRKVRRAERERLQYISGRSEPLLHQFYSLLLRTRRRHRIPPQPFTWFRNLADCMQDRLLVHLALKAGQPTAGILTLSHRQTILYKYGCSDERFNQLGGMPFLFWQVIQTAKADGKHKLDLGRSETSNAGLVAFKEHLGAKRSSLTNWTCKRASAQELRPQRIVRMGRRLMPRLPAAILRLPESFLAASGGLFYRHMD